MWGEIGEMKPNYIRPWRFAFSAIILIATIAFIVQCTANLGIVPPEKMSPKELAVYAMRIYNQQYDLYMQKASLPDLSDAEKKILRGKKDALTAAFHTIKTYTWYVDGNMYPPAELQRELLKWINSVRY